MIGRVVAETVDGRTTRFAYDAAGRRTARITPTGAVARSAYDEVGNRTALRSDGHTLAFAHDSWRKEVARSFGPRARPSRSTRGGTPWDG
ncbi:RHS repeat domain-containing protein [Streptomyces sp. NPDC007070]|uniref:RHS repeat domain-containing protein n=1 Tax=Streptomyces sp. NPDC007070 TaxID=3154312 RepID=UPI0033EBE90F